MQGHATKLRDWFTTANVGDLPATCDIMRVVLDAFYLRFPDQQYIIIDTTAEDQSEGVEISVETVPGTTEIELWKWDGDEGYGGIYECTFPHGQGLRLDYGGSPANSAFSIYVVPLKISDDGWVTATPVRQRRR